MSPFVARLYNLLYLQQLVPNRRLSWGEMVSACTPVLCVLAALLLAELAVAGAEAPDCSLLQAQECVAKYAKVYGCRVTGAVPLPSGDVCAAYLQPGGCLLETCSECNCTSAAAPFTPCERRKCVPQPEGTCSPGCRHASIGDGVCQVPTLSWRRTQ